MRNGCYSDVFSEAILLKALGFKLYKDDSRWIIIDSNDLVAGSIRKSKLFNGADEPKKMVNMIIDYGNLKCSSMRQEGDFDYTYTLKIDQKQGTEEISIKFGNQPKLVVKHDDKLISTFSISNNSLKLFYNVVGKKASTEHTMYFDASDRTKAPAYVLKYKKHDKKGEDECSSELGAQELDSNTILFVSSHRDNEGEVAKDRCLVNGSIEELIGEHDASIETFKNYRKQVNDTLPFKEDIVKMMFSMCSSKNEVLRTLLFKEQTKAKKTTR